MRLIMVLGAFLMGGLVRWMMELTPEKAVSPDAEAIVELEATTAPGSLRMEQSRPHLKAIVDLPPWRRPPLALHHVAEASVPELQALHARACAEDLSVRWHWHATMQLVYLRWLEMDPASALATVREMDHFADAFFALWGAVNLEEALAHMNADERTRYLSGMLQEEVTKNPKRFVELFLEGRDLREVLHNPDAYLDVVLAERPDLAKELALPARCSDEELTKILKVWLAHDPTSVRAWANALNDVVHRKRALTEIYRYDLEDDPDSVVASLAALPPGALREEIVGLVALAKAERNVGESLEWVSALETRRGRSAAMSVLVERHAHDHPDKIIESLREMGLLWNDLSSEAENAIRSAMRLPMQQDLVGTIDTLSEVTDSYGISRELQERGFGGVAREILAARPSALRSELLADWVTPWAKDDLLAVTAFVNSLDDPFDQRTLWKALESLPPSALLEVRDQIPASVWGNAHVRKVRSLAMRSPDEAYETWQEMEHLSPEWKAKATVALVASWSGESARRIDMLATLPIDEQEPLYPSVAYRFTIDDPQAASEWMATLSPGAARDQAIGEMIRALTSSPHGAIHDLEGAFHWARVMHDPVVREGSVSSVLHQWKRRNAREARAAVESLPAEERQPLLEILDK